VTEKQTDRVKTKIKRIRGILAAEKRQFGGYDDSRGLRYIPPGLYIKMEDYAGGLTYLRWFKKNFSDDAGFPDFLFEWMIILFMNNKLKEAEKKAVETFCSNTYLFDKFFGKEILPIKKYEGSNIDSPEFTQYLPYRSEQPELGEFAKWLSSLSNQEKFKDFSSKFIAINKRLHTEDDDETRGYLFKQLEQMKENYE